MRQCFDAGELHFGLSLSHTVSCFHSKSVIVFVFGLDGPSVDLEQLDLQMLCDGLRRYLLDLPQPVIHSAIYTEMVHIAQGENE